MWLSIANIVVASFAIVIAIVAVVKVKKEKREALALLQEASLLSDKTLVKTAKVEQKIEELRKEIGRLPHEKD